MKKRLELLKKIEAREPLTMCKVSYVGGDEMEEYPGERRLLYDIATSLRLLIDAVVETWTE